LTGIARIIRSAVVPALENIALFMERDISHSSVERVILPQICILLDYALVRLKILLEGIQVNESKIKANLEMSKNLILSSKALFELVLAGVPRDKAYKIIQRVAFDVIEGKAPDFKTALISYLEKEDKKLASIISEKLSLVKPNYISLIFSRAKNMPFDIKVKKKPEVFDPEGKAIKDKLEKLGYQVEDIRVGKVFEIRTQNGRKDMIENFFINPIVETYEIELKE
jgi:phosphoribosylformylglycinamidine synthase, purS protein